MHDRAELGPARALTHSGSSSLQVLSPLQVNLLCPTSLYLRFYSLLELSKLAVSHQSVPEVLQFVRAK